MFNRPYEATLFKNILRLGDIKEKSLWVVSGGVVSFSLWVGEWRSGEFSESVENHAEWTAKDSSIPNFPFAIGQYLTHH